MRKEKSQMQDNIDNISNPDRIGTYFRRESGLLILITISGILYNIGMIAGPWFEGQLAQCLLEIMRGDKQFADMLSLAVIYVIVILLVQLFRFVKRLYVRKFGNHVNRDMKSVLYASLVHKSKEELEAEGAGNIMTKAIADVDTCAEGMRKFITEVFDTGVVMIAYVAMLLYYDWRIALLSMIFPPAAYAIAARLKRIVAKSASAYKASAGKLNTATLDRIHNAVTYRVYGQEANQNAGYEIRLKDYEKRAVRSNIWETAMQPLYHIISMMSVLFILWFGAQNVLGQGWTTWNIAAFTTFLSCFMKLAAKASKGAKLFNAVQKAAVSWGRIKPYMTVEKEAEQDSAKQGEEQSSEHVLTAKDFSFRFTPEESYIWKKLDFTCRTGEFIGITGSVACGKSTLGKVLLGEFPYEGSLKLQDVEMSELQAGSARGRAPGEVGYMGHEPELLSATIEENILLGETGDVGPYLKAVCMDQEMQEMENGIHTMIGNGGVRLSGGQQARIALARTLYHRRPVMVLDDPFSAVDKETELRIMQNLKAFAKNQIVFIISHRLSIFPQMNQIIWMEAGKCTVSEHDDLLCNNSKYAQLYQLQNGGGQNA